MTIKLNRARNLADVGQFPSTWAAIIAAMPESVLNGCTARQVADIADAMRQQYIIGHDRGYADAAGGAA